MTPEQQRIIQALLAGGMPQGDMQGASPLRQRQAMAQAQRAQQGRADQLYDAAPRPDYAGAGFGGMTGEPFNPLEEMAAPVGAGQAGAPAIQQMLADLPPEAQSAIMQAVQQGMSPDDAIAQVLGIDMNAITRGR